MATEYEIAARWRKAVVIASHLYVHGITAREAASISRADWNGMAARLEHRPPSEQTIQVISEVLQVLETAVAQKIAQEKAKEKSA